MKSPMELFGVECGKGWHKLIEPLIERCKAEGVEISQIKEKFGTLRFYTATVGSEELQDEIERAEMNSQYICEECGEVGQLRSGGWIRTLCDKHAEGREPMKKGWPGELVS